MDKEYYEITMVYKGRRIGRDDKIFYLFEDAISKEEFTFKSKFKGVVQNVGVSYKVQTNGQSFRSLEYQGRKHSAEIVSTWITKDQAAYSEYQGIKEASKKSSYIVDQHLRDLNKHYKSLRGVQRNHFLAKCVNQITK